MRPALESISLLPSSQQVAPAAQQLAAVAFKNTVRRQWPPDSEAPIEEADRITIKTHIMDTMLAAAEPVQRQLSEAIATIAHHDFPEQWQDFLPNLVAKLAQPDLHVINGVLRTANPLFQGWVRGGGWASVCDSHRLRSFLPNSYRYQQRSDDLFREIIYVLGIFAQPLTDLFKTTLQAVTVR